MRSEPSWVESEGKPLKRRDHMPKPKQAEKVFSLWSIIKECIGRDLSRVCLPVYFNEPVSALQKSAEDLEYCELLDKVRPLLLLGPANRRGKSSSTPTVAPLSSHLFSPTPLFVAGDDSSWL